MINESAWTWAKMLQNSMKTEKQYQQLISSFKSQILMPEIFFQIMLLIHSWLCSINLIASVCVVAL